MVTNRQHQAGFTLIEMVVGIVVMAVALSMLSSVFFSDPARSVRPMLQIRAAVFGQALMDEILGKAFDQTTPVGGVPACTGCTASAGLGGDVGENRLTYNDVDDYNDYCAPASPGPLEDAQGNPPSNDNFDNYSMSVCVFYDGNFDGLSDTNTDAKLITVDIFYPTGTGGIGEPITFTAYRGNF
jgi:MSHA pilin protein MshD